METTELLTETAPEIGEVLSGEAEHVGSVFTGMWDYIRGILPSLGSAVLVFALGMLLSKFILKLLEKTLAKSRLDKTASGFLHSLIRVVLYILVTVIVLSVLNVPMTSIITVIGTVGLTVGLALQDSLSNVAGGFLILFSKPLKVGDFVEYAGITGTVEVIGILQTKIKKADGTTVYIPNNQISNAVIQNYTEDPKRRLDINFGIGYDSDSELAKKLISEILEQHPAVLHQENYTVRIGELADSAVMIYVRVWTTHAEYWNLYYDLHERVKKAFDEHQIAIPYPQRDIHIINQ
ncbi:MAG: mechanosensitive ion channel family protein [Oscillospiraceae bacterium]|nr:mechanosensitive ion channel family protein [Oscillospiraceae bacterium]